MFTATQFHEKSEELQRYMENPQNGFYDMPQKLAYAFVNIMGMDVHLPEREVVNMCEAIRQIKQQGIEQGMQQGQLKALKSLCSKGFSAQEAMDMIDIPSGEQQKYLQKLTEEQLEKGYACKVN